MKVLHGLAALLQVGVCSAAADCSESLGTCGVQKGASLMQLKALGKKEQHTLDSADQFRTQLATFQEFTNKMVAEYGSGKEKPSQAVLEAVKTVLQFIDSMFDSLEGFHDADVLAAEKCGKAPKCDAMHLSDDTLQELTNLYRDQRKKRLLHKECREERETYCQCLTAEGGACHEYDEYRKKDSRALLPQCAQKPANVDKIWAFHDDSIKTTDESQLTIMESCLEETKLWLDPLWEKYQACNRCDDMCKIMGPACDQNQTAFENARCSYAIDHGAHCEAWHNCNTGFFKSCAGICDEIAIRAAARFADNETGERLVCLLHTLFGEPVDSGDGAAVFTDPPAEADRPAALEACKAMTFDDDFWKIPCSVMSPPPEPPINCYKEEDDDDNEDEPKLKKVSIPCANDFMAHYTKSGLCLPNNACNPTLRKIKMDGVPGYAVEGAAKVISDCNPCIVTMAEEG